jgi:hypothetical protein
MGETNPFWFFVFVGLFLFPHYFVVGKRLLYEKRGLRQRHRLVGTILWIRKTDTTLFLSVCVPASVGWCHGTAAHFSEQLTLF